MEITEIRIKLMEESEDRLRAFCSITIDNSFVIRDLKIIDGTSGPFVAMPSRKLAGHCQRCGYKNHLRAAFCNHCGGKQSSSHDAVHETPQKLYADVAHPINSACREMIQNAVLDEFAAELSRAAQPGYRSRYDDEFDGEYDPESTSLPTAAPPATAASPPPPQPTVHRDDAAIEPNRPHFGDSPSREKVARDDEPAFGEGIF